jgi:hypothetical protein
MKQAPDKQKRGRLVLTDLEKLDGQCPGIAGNVRNLFRQGMSAEKVAQFIQTKFGFAVNTSVIEGFRRKRWVPEQDLAAEKRATTEAILATFGGDSGFDCTALAKLWEMMDKMTIAQLIAVRTLFVKIKAQNLKEQEFLFKTGQLKPPKPEDEEDADPHAQSRKALQRIKEIFGLAGDEPPKPPVRELPALATSECGQPVVNVEPQR